MDVEKRAEDDILLEAKGVNNRISMFCYTDAVWGEEQAVYCFVFLFFDMF